MAASLRGQLWTMKRAARPTVEPMLIGSRPRSRCRCRPRRPRAIRPAGRPGSGWAACSTSWPRCPPWARRRRRAPASCGCGTVRASRPRKLGPRRRPMPGGAAGASSRADRARSSWASDGTRTIRARSTTLICPLSSDTTTATASVSSVMPSAARCRVPNRSDERHLGERQERRGGEDPAVADDDGAVVEEGPRREDRAQELAREVGMDHHAGLGDLLEAGLPLQHDQGAVALARQHARGLGDLGGDVLDGALPGRREQPAERPDAPDALEAAPELGLEHDDEREQADDRARLQDLREQPQLEPLGQRVDAEQDRDADDEGDGAGAPDQAEQPVDEQRRDRDVEEGRQRGLSDERLDEREHPRASVTPGPPRSGPLRSGERVRGQPRPARAPATSACSRPAPSRAASRSSRSSFSPASDVQPRSS